MIAIVGIPLDENSSFLRGAALAPPSIRQAFHSPSANLCAENGFDLGVAPGWGELEDLSLASGERAFQQIEQVIHSLLTKGDRALSLGGDHSITYPILRAYALAYPQLNILQIDAHPDLYDEFEGNRRSHACPFARIMEAGLARRLVQVGIRAMTPHQRQQAERFSVEVVEMRNWTSAPALAFDGPLYLSLDMDALDPAFAPGVAHLEPGGFSTRQVLEIIQGINAPLVGADIVEYNPPRDPQGITAMLAAKLLKEILAKML